MSKRAVQAGGIIRKTLDNSWRTPDWLLERARVYFGGAIPYDAATAADNPTKALVYVTPSEGPLFPKLPQHTIADWPEEEVEGERIVGDGLELRWGENCWCDPSYGGHIYDWMAKISAEAAKGSAIVALFPTNRWETEGLQRFLATVDVVCFLRKRVAFVSSRDGKPVRANPFASMLIGLNVELDRWAEAFGGYGLSLKTEAFSTA